MSAVMESETPKAAARRLSASAIQEGFVAQALHAYTGADGTPLYYRIRLKHPDGRKHIRPMKLNGTGYVLGEPDHPDGKPLYRLHEIASNPGAPVWYVEGELCADRLAALGVLATTAGGATSDDKADFAPLAGRSVTIWPDNDDPGIAHADRVAQQLRALHCNVEIIDVAMLGIEQHEDVVDWLARNPNANGASLAALPRRKHTAEAREKKDKECWPAPLPEVAYLGLVGDIVRTIEPNTESDPAAILLQVLVAFGALVGRGPHVRVEGDQHHTNLFALLVGDTSKARKGTSWGRVRELFQKVENPPSVVSGLSTGEGLKYAVRDEIIKTVKGRDEVIDQGVTDKRLLVVESEFAQVLRQAARGGNTLSATIRCAWDTGTLKTLTKNDPVTATDSHICIVGHITQDELRAELTATDSANGFANRFIFMSVRRSKALPFGGGEIPDVELNNLVRRIQQAADRARAVRSIGMTAEAGNAWCSVYAALSEGHTGLLGAVTARAEAQCLRLALLYALMTEAREIGLNHLLAAISVWERAEASARYIFGSALGDPVADEIYRAIRAAGQRGLTRTEIRDLFKRNQSAERVGVALELLASRKLAFPASDAGGIGRPAERWIAP